MGKSGDGEIDLLEAKKAMNSSWTLADAGIEIKNLQNTNNGVYAQDRSFCPMG